jgi:hypothetical protein
MSVQSTNGISFPVGGSVIQFDLPSRSGLFIDGKTMFIRFRISYTQTATSATILRKPVYSVFARLDEFIGSVPVSSVFAYNQVANSFVDYNYSFADVAGQGASWGLENNNWADVDGFATSGGAGDNFLSVAAPLVCSTIANCDKLIPTGLMAPIRIQLTTEQLSNIVTSTTNISAISIVQPELCFMAVDMGSAVENMVASMSPKLVLKSRGWANSTQNSSTATGFSTYVFNHRYESIENLFFLASNTAAENKWGSSFNMLGNATTSGTFQIQVGQQLFPQLPINNTTGGRASVLQYLRECVGSITDQRNTLSIGQPNFNVFASAGTDTATTPAKFIIGLPLSKLNSVSPYQASSLLSGVSAAQMPINVLVNVGTAPAAALSLSLIAEYTELITIDPLTRQVFVEA